MERLPLVACSLDAASQPKRRAEWHDLLRLAVARADVAGGVRFRFAPDDALELRVRALAAAEKDCCAFYEFAVERTAGELALTVTAPPEAHAVLRGLFAAA